MSSPWHAPSLSELSESLEPDLRRAQQAAARLRIAGAVILVVGIASAVALYWIKSRSLGLTLDELSPGSKAAREREVGILIGAFPVYLLEGWAYLQRPDSEAIAILVVTALAAYGCFRVATLLARHR